jgi:tRNA(Ile2) C34 agmatinyltransferase TiaS
MIYVGIDDTDTLESRGTGNLARSIAAAISQSHEVFGVTRHQLFVHKDIPFTSHNSCAVIHVKSVESAMDEIFETTKQLMIADFVEGSDPGLAIASDRQIVASLVAFAQDAKTIVVTQERARQVAANCGIRFEGLGGTNGGVIGAIAGVALASLQNDGRFLLKGRNRELSGVRTVPEILGASIDEVLTLKGEKVSSGLVQIPKNATPSFVMGKAVLFVEPRGDCWVALKRP